MKATHLLLPLLLATVAMPADAALFGKSPERAAEQAVAENAPATTIWVDASWGFRTQGAANALTRAHTAFAARGYRVVSVDAVPAFDTGDQYEIPDSASGKWIKTDPEIHKDKATAAHQAYGNEWKGLVRMVKYWNNNPKHGDQKPVKPSFLIEVMALECLYGGWGGSFDREIQSFFATLADRVHDEWPDPAGLGPAISNDMDAARKQRAQQLLFQASQDASIAIDHARRGRNGDALKAWRALFGSKFPLS